MIDPNVDLLAKPRGFYERPWVTTPTEPLRRPAWDVPIERWREFVEIPELKIMAGQARQPTENQSQRTTAPAPASPAAKQNPTK